MVGIIVHAVLVAFAAFGFATIGWIAPNKSFSLPLFEVTGDQKVLAILLLGGLAYVVISRVLGKLYGVFTIASCGLGVITWPIWTVCAGGVSLWVLSQTNLWIITTPGPLLFLIMGFALSFIANL
jgi:hypothetical protein